MVNLAQYAQILTEVQTAVAGHVTTDISQIAESSLKDMIRRVVTERGLRSGNMTAEELVNYLYHDMAGLSFISRERLFELDGFEELDINAWNDIEIIIRGRREKTDYSFLSSQHALDIHQRMLRRSGTILNDATPRATADIGNGIRITVLRKVLVDDDIAVASSIRKVNSSTISREKMIESGTMTATMADFLELCIMRGASMCISGETGSGKTTLAGCLLAEASATRRTYTIEEGSREWNFVRTDPKSGKPLNSVIHTKTRPNEENPALNIDQEALIKDSLRFNPAVIAPGEIRGKEAFETMGVSNTGHTVVTTVHSNGTLDTPERIVTLAKKAYMMDDSTLFGMVSRAFPVLVHMELGEDRRRRVTEIREVSGYRNNELQSTLLWEFEVEDNIYDADGSCTVIGEFKQLHGISKNLQKQFLKKGARKTDLAPFILSGGDDI